MSVSMDVYIQEQDASEDAKVMASKADLYLCEAAFHLIFERSW